PPYTTWGRTRSGCYFCFFQQKIEWVRLKETHPHLFQKAKEFESAETISGKNFFWNQNESLAELEQPARMQEIKEQWEAAERRRRAKNGSSKLVQILVEGSDVAEDDDTDPPCLICQL